MGPVSPPMNKRARCVNAINSVSEHAMRKADPLLASSTERANDSSPVQKLTSYLITSFANR